MTNSYLHNLLGEKEEILLVTRQHWLVLLGNTVLEILSSVAIIILISVLYYWMNDTRLAWAFFLVILPLISLSRDVIVWANHQYIVTNFRVIQLLGVISKNVTDSSLEKVNDVKMTQSVLGRLFNYGDIEILTASEVGINRFSRLGKPIEFKTAMLNAKERLEHQPVQISGADRHYDVPAMIEQLDKLRQQSILTEEEFSQKKAELLTKL